VVDKLSFLAKNDLLPKASGWLKANPDVKFNGTFTDGNGVGICDWDAPNKEKVREAVKRLGVPYDQIVGIGQVLPYHGGRLATAPVGSQRRC